MDDLNRKRPPNKIPPAFTGREENTSAPLQWRHLLPVHGLAENDTAGFDELKDTIRRDNAKHKERHLKLATSKQPKEKDKEAEPLAALAVVGGSGSDIGAVTYYMYIRWLYSDYFDYPLNGLMDFTQLRLSS